MIYASVINDFGMKFNSPEFFLPFFYHLPKLWTDRFSLVNEITLTDPAQLKKSLSGIRCLKMILHGTMRNDDF